MKAIQRSASEDSQAKSVVLRPEGYVSSDKRIVDTKLTIFPASKEKSASYLLVKASRPYFEEPGIPSGI